MPRPFKCRRIHGCPGANYFKPRGVPMYALEEIIFNVDEYEAVRLADLEGMYQEEAAEKMNISRQTFGNIVESARRKIADSIVNGKALRIEGGVYKMEGTRKFQCIACSHKWEVPFGTGRPSECPQCKSQNIHRAAEDRGFSRPGFCRRRHGGNR